MQTFNTTKHHHTFAAWWCFYYIFFYLQIQIILLMINNYNHPDLTWKVYKSIESCDTKAEMLSLLYGKPLGSLDISLLDKVLEAAAFVDTPPPSVPDDFTFMVTAGMWMDSTLDDDLSVVLFANSDLSEDSQFLQVYWSLLYLRDTLNGLHDQYPLIFNASGTPSKDAVILPANYTALSCILNVCKESNERLTDVLAWSVHQCLNIVSFLICKNNLQNAK